MGLIKEYINKKWGALELENELLKLIGKYNEIKQTNLIVYASAINKANQKPSMGLSMEDYYIIFDLLTNVKSNKLAFYIETPGGSGEAAEEIGRLIRDNFEDITFVVSGEAKSAGTILVLSGNEIFMTDSGSVGPIDAQVRIGRTSISAYDYMEWVNIKRDEAEKAGKLNSVDATMVAQISPGELNLVYHALEFAKDLVVDWLEKYKFKNWNVTETRKIPVTQKMKRKKAEEIAEELTNHARWRTHGRSLKIRDLESIGLKIIRVDDDSKLADIVYRIQTVIRFLFETTSTYKLFATSKEKIFKQATPIPVISQKQIPLKQPDVAGATIKCEKCGTVHEIYAKLVTNPQIDEEMKKQGSKPFPKNNKLKCNCGFETDLSGLRNEIETKARKKIIS